MSNFNTFQLNINIFVKSGDLRQPDRKIIKHFCYKSSSSL